MAEPSCIQIGEIPEYGSVVMHHSSVDGSSPVAWH